MKKIGIYFRPFFKLKFLISYFIPFMIINGWAGIGSSLFAIGGVNGFTIAAVTWLGILWMPGTPEKLITIPAAIGIHTRLFRNDATTREQLNAMYAEAIKDGNRIKGWFKRNKKEEEEEDGKGVSEANSKRGEKNNENEGNN